MAVVGAGSAGIGVAGALLSAMVEAGIPGGRKAAARNFMVFDKEGLVGTGRKEMTEEVRHYARPDYPDGMGITEAIEQERPQLILGLSGRRGTIPEAAVRAMAAAHERPIVFPLSNPTSSTEITPEEAYTWTEGRAIVATGSPFEPVTHGDVTLIPSQCNNMYIFPGVGLGASVCAAETVSQPRDAPATVRLPCTYCVPTVHLLRTYRALTHHAPTSLRTYHAPTTHLLLTFCLPSTYVLTRCPIRCSTVRRSRYLD